MSKFDSKIKKLMSSTLTKLIKQDIKNKKLIKTGALYNSIEVKVFNRKGLYEAKVIALEYFNNLDEKFKIIEDVSNSKGYEDLIGSILVLQSEEFILNFKKNMLSTKVKEVTINFKISK